MDCGEMIISEDVQDFLVEYDLRTFNIDSVGDVCYQRINENWAAAYFKLSDPSQLNIKDFGYHSIPKLYGLTDTSSMDAAGITATLNQPFLNVAGQNTIIGFIDTGIAYNLDIFKNESGETRIGAIWDQTIQTPVSERSEYEREFRRIVGDDFAYGTIYMRQQINNAIRAGAAGEDPYSVVPSKDENGHGTFMAGIAAGGKDTDFTGAAPQAEIVMVKVKPAKKYLRDFYLINDKAIAYEEIDLMLGVRFLLRYAGFVNRPLVICFTMGTGSGPRTGATPLANLLASTSKLSNVVVVTGTGNEANQRGHVSGRAVSLQDPDTIEISVGEGEKGFVMEIWASTLDVLSISLISPSGETIPRIPARNNFSSIYRFLLEGTQVAVSYKIVESMSGIELIFLRFIGPTKGIWRVNIYSVTNIDGAYNAWLPIKQFLSSDTFLLRASPYITLLEPSADEWVISAGAYDHTTGAVSIDSGRGYTANNQIKPELVAPGVNVYGPSAGGEYTYMSGTSVAVAHVAGAAALLLTWGVFYQYIPYMGTSDVKYILIRGADRAENESYPNRITGYGKMDLIRSFTELRIT